jgi:hypothetical protein
MRANGVRTRNTDHVLTLKRASKSRPSGQWSDDDYDVFDGDQHIGRIMWTHHTLVLDDHGACAAVPA